MESLRLAAYRNTRASRMSLGPHVRFRGEAATLAAVGVLTFAILSGVSLVVVASGVCAALANAVPPLPKPLAERRDAIATLRGSVPSLPA